MMDGGSEFAGTLLGFDDYVSEYMSSLLVLWYALLVD